MRIYLTTATLFLILLYASGCTDKQAEYIADKCEVSDGDYPVLIDNEYFVCFGVER